MKQITINGKQFSSILNIRAVSIYSDISGKDIGNVSSILDITNLAYACIRAAEMKEGKAQEISLDWLMDNVEVSELESIVSVLMPEGKGE
jgi:hypothetical protein